MMNKDFDEIAKEYFKFLESDFQFQLLKNEKKDGGYELIYLNKTTGVKITYEFAQAYIFITLFKLVDGTIPENPKKIKAGTPLHGYELDDIISIRNVNALIEPAYKYGQEPEFYDKKNGLKRYVGRFADNLRTYAPDVLSGNFEIFREAHRVVMERVNNYK